LTHSLRDPKKEGKRACFPDAFSANALSTAVMIGETKKAGERGRESHEKEE
jgi:hypothetical protein